MEDHQVPRYSAHVVLHCCICQRSLWVPRGLCHSPFKWEDFALAHLQSVRITVLWKSWLMCLKATAEHIHQAQFALDVKKAVLPLYEKVFDVGYPLPKLDTLVVSIFLSELSSYVMPTSFSPGQRFWGWSVMCCLYDYMITDVSCTLSGAMENWGLITGRTNAFLLDPKNADLQAKKQIASTQSHEVAHMW